MTALKQLDALAALNLSHPTRLRIALHLLEHKDASPNRIRLALDEPISLGAIAYHVRKLRDDGIIRPVREGRVRGAVEHHYALTAGARKKLQKTLAKSA